MREIASHASSVLAACVVVMSSASRPALGGTGPVRARSPLLRLVPRESWPSPPGPRDLEPLIERLSDVRLSYEVRAEAARALSGATDRPAVQALASALLELPRDSSKRYRILRVACAQALGWAAADGDGAAIRSLWSASLDPHTNLSAPAVAKALLDASGAEEIMRLTAEALRGREPRLKADGKALAVEAPLRAWPAFLGQVGACHFISSKKGLRGVLRPEIRRLVVRLRSLSTRDFVRLLDGQRGSVVASWTDCCGEERIPCILVRGLSNRRKEAREALVRWLCGSEGAWNEVYVCLDGRALQELDVVSRKVEPESTTMLQSLLEKLCHGRTKEVLAGKESLEQACWSVVERVLTAGSEIPPRMLNFENLIELELALKQLAFAEVRKGETHPLLRVLAKRDLARPRFDLGGGHEYRADLSCLVAGILEYSSFPGVPRGQQLRESALGLILGRIAELDLKSHDGRGWLASLTPPATRLALPKDRANLIRSSWAKLGSTDDRLPQALFLYAVAPNAYSTPDAALPLDIGSALVECLEGEMAKPTQERHQQVLNLIRMALAHLTPERLPGIDDDVARNLRAKFGYPSPTPPEPDPAAWRAWLERFRKLPVFHKGR